MGADQGRDDGERAYATPTGEACPRWVRADGTVEGVGACQACGTCLLIEWGPWAIPE